MNIEQFLLFFVSSLAISSTPGPNMLLAFVHGVNFGVRRTLWTLAGLSSGLFVLLCVALFGLGFINHQLPWALVFVKIGGALYLAYLGIKAWYDKSSLPQTSTAIYTASCLPAQKAIPKPNQLFWLGVWVSLSNPKAILFFVAFFPKFINFNAPIFGQYVLLTLGFFVGETLCQLAYVLGGRRLAGWLQDNNRLLWLNRLCGVLFVLIACGLLWEVLSSFDFKTIS